MLGMLGLLILVAGAFTAGGGIFNWEFFFSDGYREHGWSRSLGREGARGVLMLLGGVFVAAGFVSQIVDAASKPVAVRALANAGDGASADDAVTNRDAPDSTSLPNEPTFPAPRSAMGPTQLAPPEKSRAGTSVVPAPAPPLGTQRSAQQVTIWGPDPAPEDTRIFLILQYRFEPGHQSQPGRQYTWVIELEGLKHEIAFEGETLQKQGQLTHLFDASAAGGGFNKPWSTWIEMEAGSEGQQISNKLEIDGRQLRSLPLSPTQ